MAGGNIKDKQTCFNQWVVYKIQMAYAIIDSSLQDINIMKTLSDSNGDVVQAIQA